MKNAVLVCLYFTVTIAVAQGAPIILNEFNAVANDEFLDDDDPTRVDTFFGRVMGNGGNWIELVVVQDHLDLRGYQLLWAENDSESNGADIWYGDGDWSQGIITFSETAALWSDLRSGTILTISEKEDLDTEDYLGNPVYFDLSTDISFDPFAAIPDWTIHISTRDEINNTQPLVTTVTNVDGDDPGDFSVGRDDWQLTISDGSSSVFGPVGEAISGWGGGGINDSEVGRLEADPSALISLDDYDDATSSTFGSENEWGGTYQNFDDLRGWVPEPTGLPLLAVGILALTRRRKIE